jgi:hypothetical protein
MAQIDFASMNLTQLLAARSQIDADIAMKTGGAVAGTSVTKSGKIRKTPKNAGKPTAYGDFSSKIQKEHAEEIKAFKAANPEIKGAHFSYVGTYKKEHEDEYKAFLAEWETTHPKDAESAADEDAEEKSQTSSQKRRGPKKLSEMTPEELVKHKKAVAARKAKKEAAASESASEATPAKKTKKVTKKEAAIVTPVAVVTEDEDPELLPFKHKGKNYLRLGAKREDGKHLWTSGNLWESKKGAKGAYVGCLQADGTIDPDEELEPIIE